MADIICLRFAARLLAHLWQGPPAKMARLVRQHTDESGWVSDSFSAP